MKRSIILSKFQSSTTTTLLMCCYTFYTGRRRDKFSVSNGLYFIYTALHHFSFALVSPKHYHASSPIKLPHAGAVERATEAPEPLHPNINSINNPMGWTYCRHCRATISWWMGKMLFSLDFRTFPGSPSFEFLWLSHPPHTQQANETLLRYWISFH